MNSTIFAEIVERADAWTWDGEFIPDEKKQGETVLTLVQDRHRLIEMVHELSAARYRKEVLATRRGKRIKKALETGADFMAKYEQAVKHVIAMSSVLPYRKNNHARTVQAAANAWLTEQGYEKEVQEIARQQAVPLKQKKNAELQPELKSEEEGGNIHG